MIAINCNHHHQRTSCSESVNNVIAEEPPIRSRGYSKIRDSIVVFFPSLRRLPSVRWRPSDPCVSHCQQCRVRLYPSYTRFEVGRLSPTPWRRALLFAEVLPSYRAQASKGRCRLGRRSRSPTLRLLSTDILTAIVGLADTIDRGNGLNRHLPSRSRAPMAVQRRRNILASRARAIVMAMRHSHRIPFIISRPPLRHRATTIPTVRRR